MKNEKFKFLNPIFLSVTLTLLTLLFVFFKWGFYFSSNDDIMLHNLMSGVYTGTPEAHLIYIMYPLGLLFKGLYTAAPCGEWFEAYILFCDGACVFLIIFNACKAVTGKTGKIVTEIITYAVLMLLCLKYINGFQYTVHAGLLMITACFYIASLKKFKGFDYAIIILLLINGMWMREMVFLMLMPLVCLAAMVYIYRQKEILRPVKEAIIPVCIFLLLVIASFLIEKYAYRSVEWQEYMVFNDVRVKAYDYGLLPRYVWNFELYEEKGIPDSIAIALDQYDIEIIPGMSAAFLEELVNESEMCFTKTAITSGINYFKSYYGVILILAFLFSFTFFLIKKDRFSLFVTQALMIFDGAVTVYFIYLQRVLERVMMPLIAASVLLMLACALKHIDNLNIKKIIILMGISATLLIVSLFVTDKNAEALSRGNDKWNNINEIVKEHDDGVCLLETNSYTSISEKMFLKEAVEAKNSYRLGTWTSHSPLQEKKKANAYAGHDKTYFIIESHLSTDWVYDILDDFELIKVQEHHTLY